VTTAALIALAKVGSERSGLPAGTLSRELAQSLKDKNQEVSETAAAALGILGDDPSALLLSELLIDSEQGRGATGRREVGVRTRSFAAYGLAVLGHRTANVDVRRYIVHKLDQALAADDTPSADFGTACVIALGRIFLDWRGPSDSAGERQSEDALPAASSREGQIEALLAVLRDDDRDRIVRAHVPVSLAALLARDSDGAPPALRDEVTKELTLRLGARKRESRELQQSCVIALGLYGDNDDDATDRAIRELLRDIAARVGDRQLRNFALISLARVGARNGRAAAPPVDDTVEYLLERLGRGNDTGQWAALALGVFARQLAASGRIPSADINVSLREKLRGSSTPLDVGALAIASGLARDLAAQEPLLEKLAKVDEERARGHAAIALGLLDSEEALDPIREILDDATYRPTLLRELAIAPGLRGDPNVARELVSKLEEAQSHAAQASIAQALGRIGVAESVAPLVGLLASDERSERARAFAAVALGIVIDKDDLPWNAVLSVNTNYVAAPPTLYDGQGFGILNIL
jgi:HEAT repeat protein